MADESKEFRPDECETFLSEDRKRVKIVFRRDSGETQEAVLARTWIPQLIVQLQTRIEPGQATPIDRGSLRIGQTFSLQGYQVGHRPDGSAILTLFVDLPDQGRVVTIPLVLPPPEITQFIQMLAPMTAPPTASPSAPPAPEPEPVAAPRQQGWKDRLLGWAERALKRLRGQS